MALNVTHAFVSAKSDGADPTLVQPSNWNASHVVANLANASADNGDLVISNNTSPVAPGTGTKLISQSVASRGLPGWIGPTGQAVLAQPLIGRRDIQMIAPQVNGSALTSFGTSTGSTTGTMGARVVGSGSVWASSRRVSFTSSASASSVGGLRVGQATFWRGNAAGLGGFFVLWRFAWSEGAAVSTAQGFAGLWATTTAPTDVGPDTLTNIIGIGMNNGDTQMQLYAAGSGAQTRTALGASFPANTTQADVYELALWCPANASGINYQVTRINTGDTTSGTITNSLNLPSATTFLAPQMWRSNGGTASAVAVDFMQFYAETDY